MGYIPKNRNISDMEIVIINGPNLNLLGPRRKPEIYGSQTWEETLNELSRLFPGVHITGLQSNSEGEIVDMIQKYGYDDNVVGIVLNPGAYAHYSLAIADAVDAIKNPVVEVHISNVFAREEMRHKMVTARSASTVICGAGRAGYRLAVDYLLSQLELPF